MYIIAGLGNPGREYEKTRHNAGFEVIDRLAERLQVLSWEKKHEALAGKAVAFKTADLYESIGRESFKRCLFLSRDPGSYPRDFG